MISKVSKNVSRQKRHLRIRQNLAGKAATAVGTLVAKRALALNIEAVVFDRGGYLYHGRVKALADAARAAGLKF